MVLFDANVLVHAHVAGSPVHEMARRLRDEAAEGRLEACLSPQVLCEFFAVCTDARFVQPALTPKQANREISAYWKSGFRKILPTETTLEHLRHLVERHEVKRQQVFDAFLVATMLDHDVHTIYTQNTRDFMMYKDLTVINPFVQRVIA